MCAAAAAAAHTTTPLCVPCALCSFAKCACVCARLRRLCVCVCARERRRLAHERVLQRFLLEEAEAEEFAQKQEETKAAQAKSTAQACDTSLLGPRPSAKELTQPARSSPPSSSGASAPLSPTSSAALPAPPVTAAAAPPAVPSAAVPSAEGGQGVVVASLGWAAEESLKIWSFLFAFVEPLRLRRVPHWKDL